MPKIADPILLAIVDGLSTGGLSLAIAREVHRVAHLLLAAQDLNDVSVFTTPMQVNDNHFSVPVVGKWSINFAITDAGPGELFLEKLSKSWSEKSNRFSAHLHQQKH